MKQVFLTPRIVAYHSNLGQTSDNMAYKYGVSANSVNSTFRGLSGVTGNGFCLTSIVGGVVRTGGGSERSAEGFGVEYGGYRRSGGVDY
jgi:hypothetical protein